MFELREPLRIIISSLRQTPESSDVPGFWIPAFAGMTFLEEPLKFTLSPLAGEGWGEGAEISNLGN
jgi:hypothetical protein